MSTTLTNMQKFIEDIVDRRGDVTIGGNSARMVVELHGGSMVELTAFAPDANTYRQPFYYNTVMNCLYKKIVVEKSQKGIIAFWQRAS